MNRFILTLASLALICSSGFAQEKKTFEPVRVNIYNPKADAKADISNAVAKAKKSGKHVFIQVGGNWCGWCISFHKLVEATPDLKKYLNDNYETVLLNFSPENKNADVMANLGYPGRFGYPVFVILNGDGKVLHIQNSAYLEEGERHSVNKVKEFLQGWTAAAITAEANK